ncbi:MAG TPA: hypothetical protein VD962_06125 [Rubricoccaceae bacterium]|nr:hypothetical protein [Rubricoccaceae bacterium]
MRALPLFVTSCLLCGALAVGGSILGNAFGPSGLIAGALVGGGLGVVAAAWVGKRRGWLPPSAFGAAVGGGLAGFAVAATVAWLNAHTPVIPVLSTALVGAGAILGSRLALRASAPPFPS